MSAGNLRGTAKKRQVYLNIRFLKDSVTTSQKTLRGHYKDNRIAAVLGARPRCALCESREIHEVHCVGKMQNLSAVAGGTYIYRCAL